MTEAVAGRLSANIAYFARALRNAGLPVGPGAVIDAVAAMEAAQALDRETLYWVLHAVFVKRHEDHGVFDQAFRLFFRRRAYLEKIIGLMSPDAPGAPPQEKAPEAGALRVADAFRNEQERERDPVRELQEFSAALTVSEREVLKARDFAQMSADEVTKAMRLIARLELPENLVATRRFRSVRAGRDIDPRATLRQTLRGGGDVIRLAFRERREKHPPVVALIDISGSMAEYSRVILHFMHALAQKRGRVHSFVFGTRLTNVTRLMRSRDPDEALRLCGQAAPDWEGGTRISEALHHFNRDWSRRVLAGGAVVLLFTDGLERADDGQLGFEMDRLKRSSRRLVWLNPLLRFGGFEARAAGIRAMLPHVHEFRTIHNLSAMEALCQALAPGAAARAADPRLWLRAG